MRRSRAEERRFFRDLELRLGPSWPPKECMFAGNCERRYPDVITINDDEEEDDVLMYSMCPASSVPALELFPIRAAWVPVVTEEDLELRLGSRETISFAATQSNDVGRKEPLPSWRSFKRTKSGLASTSRQHLVIEEGVQLRCTICMDTMKEETSTICGHVFCKSCITSAIRTQNKCPTCRKELNMGSIHRIYLPGATS
ncbi:hypothetical protein Sjap_016678 [Stephania japonica]|uniref:RING-type domain-containing protein n=1 Tax=Stephania japonica TaxID=461633 RepID=A0AAP0NV74_9MAGN